MHFEIAITKMKPECMGQKAEVNSADKENAKTYENVGMFPFFDVLMTITYFLRHAGNIILAS